MGWSPDVFRLDLAPKSYQSLSKAPAWRYWQVFEDDEVRVWQRPYADSPLLEVRGEVRVSASLNALMALLRDADYNRHWVYRS